MFSFTEHDVVTIIKKKDNSSIFPEFNKDNFRGFSKSNNTNDKEKGKAVLSSGETGFDAAAWKTNG